MLNVLYSDIDWSKIKNVGFDLDGTLYDEYEFITQVYSKICEGYSSQIKDFMLSRWLEMGSSYPHIFDETFDMFFEGTQNKEEFINRALEIFRAFSPDLSLSERSVFLLEHLKSKYNLFLVSDGNYKLQKKKFDVLGLSKYFHEDNVFFTAERKTDKSKCTLSEFFKFYNDDTVFFGDRIVDEEFSKKSGIKFVKVYNMVRVK